MNTFLFAVKYMNLIGALLAAAGLILITKAISKKSINPIKRFIEDSSEDVAVRSNPSMVRITVSSFALMIGTTIYLITNKNFFSMISILIFAFFVLVDVVRMLPFICEIIYSKEELVGISDKMMGVTLKYLMIHYVLIYILDEKILRFLDQTVARLIVNEQVVCIIRFSFELIILFLLLFSIIMNSYCILAIICMNKTTEKIDQRIHMVTEKRKKADEDLRKKTTMVNLLASKQNFFANIIMGITYTGYNIKIYILTTIYDIKYTRYYLSKKMVVRLAQLSGNNIYHSFYRVMRNTIIVILLFIADIYLYLNYTENAPVVHFYELLSTVIIIPIFLTKIIDKKER